jgi:hypothetical protein
MERVDDLKGEAAPALEELTAQTMRADGPSNALAWLGFVVGSFAVCLLLLVLVAGA